MYISNYVIIFNDFVFDKFLFYNIIVEIFFFLCYFCNLLLFNEFKWCFLYVNCSIKKEEIDLFLV